MCNIHELHNCTYKCFLLNVEENKFVWKSVHGSWLFFSCKYKTLAIAKDDHLRNCFFGCFGDRFLCIGSRINSPFASRYVGIFRLPLLCSCMTDVICFSSPPFQLINFFLFYKYNMSFTFFFKFRICMQLKIWRKDYFRFWSIQILLHNHINLSIGNNAQHHSFMKQRSK